MVARCSYMATFTKRFFSVAPDGKVTGMKICERPRPEIDGESLLYWTGRHVSPQIIGELETTYAGYRPYRSCQQES